MITLHTPDGRERRVNPDAVLWLEPVELSDGPGTLVVFTYDGGGMYVAEPIDRVELLVDEALPAVPCRLDRQVAATSPPAPGTPITPIGDAPDDDEPHGEGAG